MKRSVKLRVIGLLALAAGLALAVTYWLLAVLGVMPLVANGLWLVAAVALLVAVGILMWSVFVDAAEVDHVEA